MKKSIHTRRWIAGLALAAGTLFGAGAASAAQVTLSANTFQSGFNGTTAATNPLTAADWNFTGQQYAQLASIDSITITLSAFNGLTDVAELDEGKWTLGLDGLNTGLVLDGLSGAQIATMTITGPNNAAALLAALQSDGKLAGSVIDATPGDHITAVPGIIVTSIDIVGTLSANGGNGGGGTSNVPLPAAILMAPLAAAIAGWRSRKIRNQA